MLHATVVVILGEKKRDNGIKLFISKNKNKPFVLLELIFTRKYLL